MAAILPSLPLPFSINALPPPSHHFPPPLASSLTSADIPSISWEEGCVAYPSAYSGSSSIGPPPLPVVGMAGVGAAVSLLCFALALLGTGDYSPRSLEALLSVDSV